MRYLEKIELLTNGGQMKAKHLLYIILLILVAMILSACDPAAYPFNSIDKILIVNGMPVLHVSKLCSWGIGCPFLGREDHYYSSEDFGETWKEIPSSPDDIPAPVEQPESARVVACVPDDPQICYHIAGKPQVESSIDGGKTWDVAWKMPAGREKFMEKNPEILPFLHVSPDTIPYDLGIVPFGPKHIVIVAMGNQGLLVRSPDGVWERTSLSSSPKSPELAYPLPFYAVNFKEINDSTHEEIDWVFLATFIFAIVLTSRIRKTFSAQVDQKTRSRINWALSPFFLGIGAFFLLIFLVVASLFISSLQNPVGDLIYFVLSNGWLLICMFPVIGLILTMILIPAFLPNRMRGLLTVSWILIYVVLFFGGIWISFALWAIGVIPFYEVGLGLAILLSLVVLWVSLQHLHRLANLAPHPS